VGAKSNGKKEGQENREESARIVVRREKKTSKKGRIHDRGDFKKRGDFCVVNGPPGAERTNRKGNWDKLRWGRA